MIYNKYESNKPYTTAQSIIQENMLITTIFQFEIKHPNIKVPFLYEGCEVAFVRLELPDRLIVHVNETFHYLGSSPQQGSWRRHPFTMHSSPFCMRDVFSSPEKTAQLTL